MPSFSIPSDIKNISDNLVYRDFITVGILLDKTKLKPNEIGFSRISM